MEQANLSTRGPTPSEELVKKLCEVVTASTSWMKFLGVILIICGVITACTLFGLLICWLPIWLGVILFRAAGDAEMASRGAPQKLVDFIERINKFFLIQGILGLIALVIMLVSIFVGVALLMWAMSAGFEGPPPW
jgi:hypothetical protein